MSTLSQNGASWIAERIGVALNGILGATLFFLLDWLLPRWLKYAYVTYDYIHRANSVDRRLEAQAYSIKARLAFFILPSTCLATFRIWIVPPGREILFHHGLVGYVLLGGLATLQYLMSDGTPDARRMSMVAHGDAAMCYFSTAYTLVNFRWVWQLFCSVLIWICVPVACLSAGTWMLWDRLPEVVRSALLWTIVKSTALFMASWDVLDKIEAQLVERLPKWLQYRLHRYQQYQRRSAPSYIYSPLQPGEIRLLRLKRTTWYLPGSIEADLIHVPLYPTPEYEAVSYRWGSTERAESIVLNGTTFPVTKSAYDLLIARRSLWRMRTIWIDAICINQSDNEEKATQVQLMRDIYHLAYRVVIFPGGDWTARLAAPLLYETLAATYQFDDSILDLNKLSNRERTTTKWKALKELLLNDYFTRAWVVQEVAVGQRVEIYHGGLYIDWNVFFQIALHLAHPHRREMLTLADKKDRAFLGTSSLENIAIMSFLRPDSGPAFGLEKKVEEEKRNGLEAILFSTFTFRATDPRDKVFAVLGLARYEDHAGLLTPDYGKSVGRVYWDTIEHLFFHTEKPPIHMLGLAGTGLASKRVEGIPSWVPDLQQEYLWFPFADFIGLEGSFRAGGNKMAEFQKGQIPGSLEIKGIMCDTVVFLGITTVYEGEIQPRGQQDAVHVTRQKYDIIVDMVRSMRKCKDLWPDDVGDVVDEEIWLALVAGRINRKRPVEGFDWKRVFRHLVGILERLEEKEGRSVQAILSPEEKGLEIAEGDVVTYDSATEGCYGRRFAITQQGRICWVPPYAETGDVVFVPFSAQTPFLVRTKGKMDRQDVFELVGEAYVQGMMWGELLEGEYQESVITLV